VRGSEGRGGDGLDILDGEERLVVGGNHGCIVPYLA
jgi:hypothetical protein